MKNVLVRRLIQAAICPLGLLLLASLAWAQQNSIENFDVTQTGGQVLVRVNMKKPDRVRSGQLHNRQPGADCVRFRRHDEWPRGGTARISVKRYCAR